MEKRRVVITGMGAVTPIGVTADQFWESLVEGRNGVREITTFDTTEHTTKIAANVIGFEAENYMNRKNMKRMADFTQYAIAATMQAMEQSKLVIDEEIATRTAVIVGSGAGGQYLVHNNLQVLETKGPRRVSPYLSSGMLVNSAAGEIAIKLGAKGPSSAIVTACATGSNCIGEAMKMIQYGRADAAIAGGAEGDLTSLDLASFSVIKALSRKNDEPDKASRPFDKNRDGFVIGAGAGILVLEEAEYAKNRGATILAELVGYGTTTDAYHITAPNPSGDGPAQAMKLALEDGNLQLDEVNYINAHGTSTSFNDKMESHVIQKVFDNDVKHLLVNSTKSMTGHLMGAAGAIELVACVYSILNNYVHPTRNCDDPEDTNLDYVPHIGRRHDVRVALSNSFGFGGHNTCLALRAWEE